LTDNPARDGAPAWSPDGTRIAFVSNRDGNWEIYSVRSDESDEVRLTDDPGSDLNPAWSPDGSQIAFTTDRSGNMDLFRMTLDGEDPINVTSSPDMETWFVWAPDGEAFAVSSCSGDCVSPDSHWASWRISTDGATRIQILEAAASCTWEP
jgi:TolB protein